MLADILESLELRRLRRFTIQDIYEICDRSICILDVDLLTILTWLKARLTFSTQITSFGSWR